MIEQGEAKDVDAETRWLTSLPDGKVTVADATGGPAGPDVAAIVAIALPEFQKLDAARKSALLDVVSTLNPWVSRRVIRGGGENVDGVRRKATESVRYEVAEGRPLLVPDMSYLEAHATKGRSRK